MKAFILAAALAASASVSLAQGLPVTNANRPKPELQAGQVIDVTRHPEIVAVRLDNGSTVRFEYNPMEVYALPMRVNLVREAPWAPWRIQREEGGDR